ncbi:TatD family deoxyribonuclease [candidate division KSB1 bacterium]|nr:TatD family deoxyribonuclease [candidate division KSB1 bacterium]
MIIDAHTHIDRYTDHLHDALQQIRAHRILSLSVAMDIESYQKNMEIAEHCEYIKPIFGIHPWEAHKYSGNLSLLDKYLIQTPMIGESGLDFRFIKDVNLYKDQRQVFEYQCKWASELNKGMNLHTVGAEKEVLDMLTYYNIRNSIVHWYSGPDNLIKRYIDQACYFTVGIEITVSEEKRNFLKKIPIDRLLLETDNPGGYEWLTKEIGMPNLIFDVLEKTARILKMDSDILENQIYNNWKKLMISEK